VTGGSGSDELKGENGNDKHLGGNGEDPLSTRDGALDTLDHGKKRNSARRDGHVFDSARNVEVFVP